MPSLGFILKNVFRNILIDNLKLWNHLHKNWLPIK